MSNLGIHYEDMGGPLVARPSGNVHYEDVGGIVASHDDAAVFAADVFREKGLSCAGCLSDGPDDGCGPAAPLSTGTMINLYRLYTSARTDYLSCRIDRARASRMIGDFRVAVGDAKLAGHATPEEFAWSQRCWMLPTLATCGALPPEAQQQAIEDAGRSQVPTPSYAPQGLWSEFLNELGNSPLGTSFDLFGFKIHGWQIALAGVGGFLLLMKRK